MNKETKRKLEKLDKEFKERLKWVTSRKYDIPRSYAETVIIVRKMYIEFVDDIFKSQRKVFQGKIHTNCRIIFGSGSKSEKKYDIIILK